MARQSGFKSLQLQKSGLREQDRQQPDHEAGISPLLSIVIPTRNEASNVSRLIEALNHSVNIDETELIFVDDSDDDTPRIIEEIAQTSAFPIRLIHRSHLERKGGLGGAVVEGFRAARAPWLCVMDGDLQHPPELVNVLFDQARINGADLAIASRYCRGGSAGALGPVRTLLSSFLIKLAQLIFPLKLRGVSDPLTGFFVIKRDVLPLNDFRPKGFKILIEILIRCRQLKIFEIPMHFQTREYGQSKASIRELQRYIMLLTVLRLRGLTTFIKFAIVGLSGLLVNTAGIAFFTEVLSIHYLMSAILATQCSTLWNFGLTERWVFRTRRAELAPLSRLVGFALINNLVLVVRGPALYLLVSQLEINYLVANAFTLVGFMMIRFSLADLWIWAEKHTNEEPTENSYSIHGILRVSSNIRLPELEEFRVEALDVRPDILVRPYGRSYFKRDLRRVNSSVLDYSEILGNLGFATTIDKSQAGIIEVAASPMLCRSPHVLYTNVIEPILRWSFVERGYALIHAACIAEGSSALLITARTDTGKTTTILRALDQFPLAFLSDDLSLLHEDGSILSYPKPLTISRHTLRAVRMPLLSLWERIALIVQSRVHSRNGRKFAHFLKKTGLPVATINLLAQWLIPPPKYSVRRLVPSVKIAEGGRLSNLIVIERGVPSERFLSKEEAFDLLMSNTEDAFGFPPYDQIETFLRVANGNDLKDAEAAIVSKALMTCDSAKIIARQNYDWWRALPINAPPQDTLTIDVPSPVTAEIGG